MITPEEIVYYDRLIAFIRTNPHCFERSNSGHITSSAWLINAEGTHVLLTHHKKFNEWIQLGGHNDGEIECSEVALKEAQEESGIEGIRLVSMDIFDIDIHEIPNSCAYHYDIRYLLQAPKNAQYYVSEESHDLAWVPFKKITDYTRHPSVIRMNEKFKNLVINTK